MSANRFLVFLLDGQRYALPLESVERVIRAVQSTPLPAAPEIVLGAVDLGGRVLPLLNMRHRFGLRERPVRAEDHFLIARAGDRSVALVIDEAQNVLERKPEEIVDPAGIAPGLEQLRGVIKQDDGLVLIHDLEQFLSLDEAQALNAAMLQAQFVEGES